ncbi:MAG: hypothetical protein JNN12_09270 [Bacteroidetes Order II. Incertae sedis bacterium]|nr:hypothetical protein [Bacteroidetes Order II. bacterium]
MEYQILEQAYHQSQKRLETFQMMSATERYQNLMDRSPHILQQIPLIYIASYLGINNASLSKIRKTLSRKSSTH